MTTIITIDNDNKKNIIAQGQWAQRKASWEYIPKRRHCMQAYTKWGS